MAKLAVNNVHVHAVMKLASHENWTVEEFLAECVVVLAKVNEATQKAHLDYMNANPAQIIFDKEFRAAYEESNRQNAAEYESMMKNAEGK